MDLIQRKFKVKRGEKEIIYPFTTYPCIFSADKLPPSPSATLQLYLAEVFKNGVPALSQTATEQPQLIVETERRESELTSLADKANYSGMGKKQHECVQHFFLDNDAHTIAIEIPVWNDTTLGHIDLIRILGDRIQVLDFKPDAHKETKAAGQVLRYISMLSTLLNLPLRMFEGAYFDNKNSYFLKF